MYKLSLGFYACWFIIFVKSSQKVVLVVVQIEYQYSLSAVNVSAAKIIM